MNRSYKTNNRYVHLKNRISKTMKSFKYTILNRSMNDLELREYMKKVESGVISLLSRDYAKFIKQVTEPQLVELHVSNQYLGLIKLSVDSNAHTSFPEVDECDNFLTSLVKGYFETFLSSIKQDTKTSDTEIYVNAILEEYLRSLSSCVKLKQKDDTTMQYDGRLKIF